MGNIDAKRDWGYAPEYTEMMWLMLQQKNPDDYVVATGETHTVREFIEKAFGELDMRIVWQGQAAEEVGIDAKTKQTLIKIDPRYFRPTEVDILIGDPKKAKTKLGWVPKVKFGELVKIMVQAVWELVKKMGY